jgi:hypothetical protein
MDTPSKTMVIGKCLMAEIVDGTSNSMVYGECAGLHKVYLRGRKQVLPYTVGVAPSWLLNAAFFDYNTTIRVRGTTSDGTIAGTLPDVGCGTVNLINSWGTSAAQFYSFHPGVAGSLRADGSVQYVGETIDINVMAALVTRSGGESIAE